MTRLVELLLVSALGLGWVAVAACHSLLLESTPAAGSTVAATGAVNVGVWAATQLTELVVMGFDATPGVAVYVLTLTVASGSAASTVSAAHLSAVVI